MNITVMNIQVIKATEMATINFAKIRDVKEGILYYDMQRNINKKMHSKRDSIYNYEAAYERMNRWYNEKACSIAINSL